MHDGPDEIIGWKLLVILFNLRLSDSYFLDPSKYILQRKHWEPFLSIDVLLGWDTIHFQGTVWKSRSSWLISAEFYDLWFILWLKIYSLITTAKHSKGLFPKGAFPKGLSSNGVLPQICSPPNLLFPKGALPQRGSPLKGLSPKGPLPQRDSSAKGLSPKGDLSQMGSFPKYLPPRAGAGLFPQVTLPQMDSSPKRLSPMGSSPRDLPHGLFPMGLSPQGALHPWDSPPKGFSIQGILHPNELFPQVPTPKGRGRALPPSGSPPNGLFPKEALPHGFFPMGLSPKGAFHTRDSPPKLLSAWVWKSEKHLENIDALYLHYYSSHMASIIPDLIWQKTFWYIFTKSGCSTYNEKVQSGPLNWSHSAKK